MISKILKFNDFYGVSKTIDIAKGINKIPTTLKEAKDQIIRHGRKRN